MNTDPSRSGTVVRPERGVRRHSSSRAAALVAFALALRTVTASAAPDGAPVDAWGDEKEDAGWTFYFDNDTLTPVQRDEDYTGGIALTLAGHRAQDAWVSIDAPLGWIDRLLLDDASNGTFQLHSIQIGGLAFTPGSIKDSGVRDGDRPYASLLYVANGRSYVSDSGRTAYHTSLSVGLLGTHIVPEFQNAFHEAIGANKPKGWNHQISDSGEPTFRYTLTRQDLALSGHTAGNTDYEVKHSVAGSIGYLTEGSVALSWRWGRINTPWWAGPPDRVEYIAEPAPATGGSVLNPGVRELYIWGGIKAHARLYNSFLQGQLRDSDLEYNYHEVRPLIGEAWIGVTAQIAGEYRLSWVMRYQTSELKPEPGDRSMVWGGLVLSHDL